MITAEIDPADIARLSRVFERAQTELKKDIRDLTRQAMIFAIQSAAKATGPGTASSPSKLPDQYKFRRIIKYPGSDFRYAYRKRNGKEGMFTTAKRISRKQVEKRGLRLLKRNIEIWDRRLYCTRMVPYFGTATGKYDKKSRVGRIPHYGAAKAGWLKALGRLPKAKSAFKMTLFELAESALKAAADAAENRYVPTPRVSEVKQKDSYGLIVENVVKYVTIISPNAAPEAMRKTANRMEKIIQAAADKAARRISQ